MRLVTPFMLILGACSAQPKIDSSQTDTDRQEINARETYFTCIKSAARQSEQPSLSALQIGEAAQSKCKNELSKFAEAMWVSGGSLGPLNCNDAAGKVTCTLRDSYERKIVKWVVNDVAKRRGLPVEEELMY